MYFKKLYAVKYPVFVLGPVSSLAITIIIVSNNFAPFSAFSRWSGKHKVLWISEITQHFQKYFIDYDRGSWALQKSARLLEVAPHNLVFLFQVDELHGKSENIEYFWHNFLQSFTMCLGK